MRAQIERHIGIPLDQIKVRGVLVRDVTPTGGGAELQYNLPVSKAGNDNWVTYALHDHRLKVADCHAPIGGSSSSATSSSPTTTPTTGRVVGTVREVGGPAPGLNRQLPGTVTATSRSGRHWHATTTATQPFSLTLPAGTYRLTGTSPLINSGQSECSALAPAVVVGDKTTHIEVVCSIR
jgi:cellulase/cellobiase CelA1